MGEVFAIGAATALSTTASATRSVTLARSAVSEALASAQIAGSQIGAVFVACPPASARSADRRRSILEALNPAGKGTPQRVFRSSAEALYLGSQAVEMGVYDIVMCIGLDDQSGRRWPETKAVRPYAASAQRYLAASGATVAHLARVAAKNHRNGALRPNAAPPAGLAAETVLESEMVAWPLRRLMVAPRSVGAAVVVLASSAGRRHLTGPLARVLACAMAQEGGTANGASAGRAARIAYQLAGVGPEDIDCAEVDDRTAAAELAAYEALQFAPMGQGRELIDSGFTALGGVLPVNTSGGLLTLGSGQAGGIAQVSEVAAQVRGAAGASQVHGARLGLAHSRGGSEHDGGPVALTIIGSG